MILEFKLKMTNLDRLIYQKSVMNGQINLYSITKLTNMQFVES